MKTAKANNEQETQHCGEFSESYGQKEETVSVLCPLPPSPTCLDSSPF